MNPREKIHRDEPGLNATIRAATSSDMDAIGRLGALLVKAHHDFDEKRFIAATNETPQGYGSFLRSQLSKDNVFVLVAEVDGSIAGYAYAGLEGYDWMALRGPAGAIYDILVDPARRRHGIGESLLAAAIAKLESVGAPQIVLSTAYGNTEAQRLFERAGFRRTMIEMTRD